MKARMRGLHWLVAREVSAQIKKFNATFLIISKAQAQIAQDGKKIDNTQSEN